MPDSDRKKSSDAAIKLLSAISCGCPYIGNENMERPAL